MVYPCFEGLNFKRKQILSMYTHTHTKKDCGKESKRKLVERYFESKYIRPVIHHLGVTFNCYVKHDNEP